MIVYGDPSFEADPKALATGLVGRARILLDGSEKASRSDECRSLLIVAGQLAQGLWDEGTAGWGLSDALIGCAQAVLKAQRLPTDRLRVGTFRFLLTDLEAFVESTDFPASIHVKVPEGFAFYGLFPEQYAEASRRWATDNGLPSSPVLTVGLRTIGTTLGATVHAALFVSFGPTARRRGTLRYTTIRPFGHPFERVVELPEGVADGVTHGLIVDEGPGLSGSSMAAAAAALERAGVPRDRIVFFPGHGGDPGGMASDEVRRWWAETPRYVVPLSEMRWDGRTLPETLAARSAEALGDGDPAEWTAGEVGGGLWRAHAYADPADWPAVYPAFERPKYRCVGPDGRAVLWKFEGLAVTSATATGDAASEAFDALTRRAANGWCPAPVDKAMGFVGVPWIEGRRLTRADAADPAFVRHLGRYIASVAGSPQTPDERAESVARIADMLYWNTHEALGEEAAERTRALVVPAADAPPATYGDGRLAPHEWVRDAAGRVWKTDCVGHDADHTVVGRQSVAWDLAGAMVEWGLTGDARDALIVAYADAGGPPVSDDALRFYGAAYAAFRLGMAVFALGAGPDDAERERLERAAAWYRDALAPTPGPSPGGRERGA